jgi:hypothetical protein
MKFVQDSLQDVTCTLLLYYNKCERVAVGSPFEIVGVSEQWCYFKINFDKITTDRFL